MLLLLVYLYLSPTTHVTAVEKYISGTNNNEPEAVQFLHKNEAEASANCNKLGIANWNYESNLTEYNKKRMLEVQTEHAHFAKETWEKATKYAWKSFRGPENSTYRWFKSLALLGDAALPDKKLEELHKLIAKMSEIYSTAKICESKGSCRKQLALEPELVGIMATSRDYKRLKYVWEEWRKVTGNTMKNCFARYVQLKNEAAVLNGFNDAGELWRESYESPDFENQILQLWERFKPFYEQLHAYVRKKLIEAYPGKIKPDGPIPAHLLGNMWAQTWGNIANLVKPYPNEPAMDATTQMKAKSMTPKDMFKMSEEFFTSLGLKPMTAEFWNKSIIEKPTNRELVCHASAWDFCDGKDFRIKMCTKVNMEDFITIHHEMGHIQYYQQYAHLPNVFRTGANPGFHEAVGDVLALSVSTPKHLHEVKLLDKATKTKEATINYLLNMALNKMAFLPFGYAMDSWRWGVFNGNISQDEMNKKWWELRFKLQGLCPPSKRTEESLDPVAKYHTVADVPYIRYFVSYVVQFQFHKALCKEAGHTGPLHTCDIYRNKDAGTLLSHVLSKGSSVTWNRAMQIMTKGETDQMDISGILEYFKPLSTWLKEQNKGQVIGWKSDDPTVCP